MSYINRIEAIMTTAEVRKPTKFNQTRYKKKNRNKKPIKPDVPTKPTKPVKPKIAKGEKVSFSELTNTRKLAPMIQEELQMTDPFNFTNETWTRFIKKVAPKLFMSLLLDMKIVPERRKAEFARYLETRLHSLK